MFAFPWVACCTGQLGEVQSQLEAEQEARAAHVDRCMAWGGTREATTAAVAWRRSEARDCSMSCLVPPRVLELEAQVKTIPLLKRQLDEYKAKNTRADMEVAHRLGHHGPQPSACGAA